MLPLHPLSEASGHSGCSAVGSAPGLGPGGRPFESGHPDTENNKNLFFLLKSLQNSKKGCNFAAQKQNGALDEWLSQRSAKPSTAVRIRQAPPTKEGTNDSLFPFFFVYASTNFFLPHCPAGVLFGHPPALKGGFIRPPNAISISVPLLSVPCSACLLCRCRFRSGCGSAGNRK